MIEKWYNLELNWCDGGWDFGGNCLYVNCWWFLDGSLLVEVIYLNGLKLCIFGNCDIGDDERWLIVIDCF